MQDTKRDWIGSHQRSFTFFGGLPELVVPDNLLSGVTKAHRYEPDLNPAYLEMATYYGVAIARKPKDKAKAEMAVQIVERWILASLLKHTFFSLPELNQTLQQLLLKLKHRPFKKLPGLRSELFHNLDKTALKALSMTP